MRFKAKMALEQVQLLSSLIAPIAKLAPSSASADYATTGPMPQHLGGNGGTVMRLDKTHMRISTRGTAADGDGIACYAELATANGIFLEHRIESAAENIIVFEIDLAQLRLALQSVFTDGKFSSSRGSSTTQPLYNSMDPGNNSSTPAMVSSRSSSVIVIKLAKRNGGLPCLCLDACTGGSSVEVHHAIPVRIMRAAEMQYHLPPRIELPEVQLELPPDRPLRPVVERLRTISPHILMEGSMAGELTLRIDGDGASIRTFYSKLVPRFEDTKATENGKVVTEHSDPAKCTLKVDSKKLFAALQWQATMRVVGSAVLCMVENEMLAIHVDLNPQSIGFFTYYIPVHFLSEDQMEL